MPTEIRNNNPGSFFSISWGQLLYVYTYPFPTVILLRVCLGLALQAVNVFFHASYEIGFRRGGGVVGSHPAPLQTLPRRETPLEPRAVQC